jgi:hypothetical protein
MAMEGGLHGVKAARQRVVCQGSGDSEKKEEEVARWQGKGRG